jgi:hypothetical protein
MVNAIKFASYESIEPAIFVCPSEYAEIFCMEWKKNHPISPYSDFTCPPEVEKKIRFIDFV